MAAKKILIIEDRRLRQENLLGRKGVEQLECIEGVDCPQIDEVEKWFEDNEKTLIDGQLLNSDQARTAAKQYDLIICHRTFLENKGLTKKMYEFAKKAKSDLVIFSGAISQSICHCTDAGNSILYVNAREMYTKSFVDFVKLYAEENVESILQLLYGPSYRLGYFLRYRNLLWKDFLGMDSDNEVDEEEVESILSVVHRGSGNIEEGVERLIMRDWDYINEEYSWVNEEIQECIKKI